MAARLMLEQKGIEYKRRDLVPVVSKGMLRAAGFRSITVPALKLDGEKIQGSMEIARHLDQLQPEPPLFPSDAGQRAKVEEAERWGDEVLQGIARRILWNGVRRDRSALGSYAEGAKLGIPTGLAVRTGAPIIALSARLNDADDEHVRADLEQLPATLDRIDSWIRDGVLGGVPPNAADFQIAPSVRLMMSLDDLRPAVETRPAGALATRVVPDFPGKLGPVLPEEWLGPLRAGTPA
jgi:glutathione S-transferase